MKEQPGGGGGGGGGSGVRKASANGDDSNTDDEMRDGGLGEEGGGGRRRRRGARRENTAELTLDSAAECLAEGVGPLVGAELRAQLEEALKRLAHLPETLEDEQMAKEVIHLISKIERQAGGAGDGAVGKGGGGGAGRKTDGLTLLKSKLEDAKEKLAAGQAREASTTRKSREAEGGRPQREGERQEGGRRRPHEFADDKFADDAASIRSDATYV